MRAENIVPKLHRHLTPPNAKRRQRTRGQSLVEFALILPLFTTILLTASDFGRAFSAYIAVGGVAREGASFGALSGRLCDPASSGVDYEASALGELGDTPQIWGTTPAVSCVSGDDDGIGRGYKWVEVTVDYTFTPLFPVGPIPDSLDMRRSVRMRAVS